MKQDSQYAALKYVAFGLGAVWLIWIFYDGVLQDAGDPLKSAYNRASRDFKDGHYDKALASYDAVLSIEPNHEGALGGKAASFSMLGRYQESLETYNFLIREYPGDGIHYANRGILHDRMGSYRPAIADYDKAYQLDKDLNKGPGWLTRFLRNQQKTPATIVARSHYLKEQLKLPPQERVLTNPPEDKKQRPYIRR